jgi:hypothetical protein
MASDRKGRGNPTERCESFSDLTHTWTSGLISQAFLYISRAFKDNAKHVMGAMKLVAASHPPEDLNRLGMHMYVSISSFIFLAAFPVP